MAKTYLLEASPRNKTTAATTSIRIAGGGSRAYNHKGFNDWRSGLASRPLFSTSIDFDQNGFSGGALPQVAPIELRSYDAAWLETLSSGFHWLDADFVLSSGDDASAAPTWTVEMSGRVKDIRRKDGAIILTVIDRSGDLDIPVLNRRFAGTGTIEGDSAAMGRPCRRTWGKCFNVEGFPLVAASNVYEFGDLNQPLNAIFNVRDKGREATAYTAIAWQGSVAATYNVLAAAVPAAGGCAYAPSIACVKWWTTPVGPLTADINGEVGTGYLEQPVQIAVRIVQARAPSVGFANPAPADALRPVSAGLHIDNESETIAQALDRLLRGVSMAWTVRADGLIYMNEISFASPVETLRVHEVERVQAYKPVRLRKIGYQRNHRVHSESEISAALLLDDGRIFQDVLDSGGLAGPASYTWFAYADSADGSVNFTTGSPGGRIFIGLGQNKTTATESTNPADYQWSLYRGPALFGLANFNGNTIVGPNFVQKIGGTGAWDASAYSTENFRGSAAMSFTVPGNGYAVMAGLNTDPLADANYTSLDFAFYVEPGTGLIFIYESGSGISTGWTNTPGTIFQIIYDGKKVIYRYGATTLYREVTVGPDIRYYFDTSLATIGGRIENITWTGGGKVGADAINNVNRVRNSGFERGLVGYGVLYNSAGVAYTEGTPAADFYLGAGFFKATATMGAAGQILSLGQAGGYDVGVTPGERLSVQVGVEGQDWIGTQQLVMWFRNAAGGNISAPTIGTLTGPQAYNTKIRGFVTVPAGAKDAHIELYGTSTNAGRMSLVLIEPMIATATEFQTEHPPFTRGPVDGVNGSNGQQGASTNVVYLKAASQPSTPAASPGVPSGWYDSSGSLPAGSDPIWISFGVKPVGSANFTWQYPVPAAAADLRLWNGLDTDGSVKPDKVDTDAMQTAAVFDSSDAFGSSGSINGSPVAIASVTRTPSAAGSKFIVMVSGIGTLDADNAASTTLAFNLDGPAGSVASGIVARNDSGRPKPYSAIRTFTPGSLSPQTFTLYANRNVSTGSLGTLSGTIVILEAKKVV